MFFFCRLINNVTTYLFFFKSYLKLFWVHHELKTGLNLFLLILYPENCLIFILNNSTNFVCTTNKVKYCYFSLGWYLTDNQKSVFYHFINFNKKIGNIILGLLNLIFLFLLPFHNNMKHLLWNLFAHQEVEVSKLYIYLDIICSSNGELVILSLVILHFFIISIKC